MYVDVVEFVREGPLVFDVVNFELAICWDTEIGVGHAFLQIEGG